MPAAKVRLLGCAGRVKGPAVLPWDNALEPACKVLGLVSRLAAAASARSLKEGLKGYDTAVVYSEERPCVLRCVCDSVSVLATLPYQQSIGIDQVVYCLAVHFELWHCVSQQLHFEGPAGASRLGEVETEMHAEQVLARPHMLNFHIDGPTGAV